MARARCGQAIRVGAWGGMRDPLSGKSVLTSPPFLATVLMVFNGVAATRSSAEGESRDEDCLRARKPETEFQLQLRFALALRI